MAANRAVERKPENPERLVQAARSGDSDAFRRLFELHRDRVYRLAFHLCGSDAAAKDVTQQVFLLVYRRLEQFRGESEFSTWLTRIVIRAAAGEHREQRRWDARRPPKPPAPKGQDELYCQHERAQLVRAAVDRLRPKLRTALILRHMQGLSYDEIARILEVSKGTVASRVNRALGKLGQSLAHLELDGED